MTESRLERPGLIRAERVRAQAIVVASAVGGLTAAAYLRRIVPHLEAARRRSWVAVGGTG